MIFVAHLDEIICIYCLTTINNVSNVLFLNNLSVQKHRSENKIYNLNYFEEKGNQL